MKRYNINNYVIYHKDLQQTLSNVPDIGYEKLNRDDLIVKFMPLTENLELI